MKNIIVSIRYSIISDRAAVSWNIARDTDFESYKEKMLNPRRLEIRRNVFKNITLKSLCKIIESKSDDLNVVVHLMTSTLLPKKEMDFLEELKRNYKFIVIDYLPPENASPSKAVSVLLDNLEDGAVYASARLDDDDALSTDYLRDLSKFIAAEYNGMAISLCSGYQGLVSENGEIISMQKRKWRFGALGLAYIGVKNNNNNNKNIYSLGNHLKIDDKSPSIVFAGGDYFFRGLNGENDSGTEVDEKLLIDEELKGKISQLFWG